MLFRSHARLDLWLEKLPDKTEFKAVEAAAAGESTSAYFVSEWLKAKVASHDLLKIGATKDAKYRKVTSYLSIMGDLL